MPKKQIYSRSTVDLPMLDVDSLDSLDSVDSDMNFLSLFGEKRASAPAQSLGVAALVHQRSLGPPSRLLRRSPKVVLHLIAECWVHLAEFQVAFRLESVL